MTGISQDGREQSRTHPNGAPESAAGPVASTAGSGVASPRWSIVIPAYNAASTLGEQLEALAAQVCGSSSEVIVADHGSTDGTAGVAQGYADLLPCLRVVDVPRDVTGPGHARNIGAAHAKGEVIIFVDADDVVAPGWFAAMTNATRRAALVGGNLDFSGLAGGPDDRGTGLSAASVEPAWDRLPTALRFLPHVSTANAAIRRDVFLEVGGFDTAYAYVEDVAFSWRVQLSGHPVAFAEDSVVWYRRRPSLRSLWRQQYNHGTSIPQAYLEFREHGARRGRPVGVAWEYLRLIAQIPVVLAVAASRPVWVSRVGFAMGLVSGSIRWRVLCL